jgi:signal transduction histidine kinase
MESILMNLITNAIKFRKPDIAPKITIKTSILNDTVQLHVIDNGMGMNWEKVKNKIFGLYQKFHNNSEGKGMGLYLVRAQVTALGGNIDMETQENLGTVFTITFKQESI